MCWDQPIKPIQPGLGQGHNQKRDTHTLDFDVTLADQGAHWYIVLPYASLPCMLFVVSVHRFRVIFVSLGLLVGQPDVWRDETTTGETSALIMIIHVLKLRLIQRQVKLTLNFGARAFRPARRVAGGFSVNLEPLNL